MSFFKSNTGQAVKGALAGALTMFGANLVDIIHQGVNSGDVKTFGQAAIVGAVLEYLHNILSSK